MKKYSTLFLRLTVILIGLPVLAAGILSLIMMFRGEINLEYKNILYPILIGLYGSMIPFYIALFNAFKLLNYIDNNKAFSKLSVDALKHIKYSANLISLIYILMMPFLFLLGDKDDAPGVVFFGLVFLFASIVISFFAAVLQRLLQDAIEIKTENDLTVWGEENGNYNKYRCYVS